MTLLFVGYNNLGNAAYQIEFDYLESIPPHEDICLYRNNADVPCVIIQTKESTQTRTTIRIIDTRMVFDSGDVRCVTKWRICQA